jgi:DNA invertase Pin-like site-specific DNA recombinase
MSVFGYVRVSTDRQANDGESLGTQQRQLEGYAMMHGFELSRVFVEEGVSGSLPIADRPQGAALMSALERGDKILAAKLDRMFRSALDALTTVEALKEKGVQLHLLDLGGDVLGNGHSKLFLTVAAAFAEAERDRIRERIAQVKADQKQRGRYLGGRPPFGFRVTDDGGMVADPAQQAGVREIVRLNREGRPLRAIAEAMRERGLAISHQGVAHVLSRVLAAEAEAPQ